MIYKILETKQALDDLDGLVMYMARELKNPEAALHFLEEYDKQIHGLKTFPFGYRGISMEYRGYEIRLKPFNTYNIFFVVDESGQKIVVLRVLKDRQNWMSIIRNTQDYHF